MIKDTLHIFFECSNCSHLRQELLTKVSPICIPSTQHFLHGTKYLTETSSIILLNAVLDFISKNDLQICNTTETSILGEQINKNTVRLL